MSTAVRALPCALLALILSVGAASGAPVYDAAGNFSFSSNPAGAWIYGSGFGADLTPFTDSSAVAWNGPALPAPVATQYDSTPASISLSDGSLLLIPTAILPNDLSQSATVRFSAPASGSYHVHALLSSNSGSEGTNPVVSIYQNGQNLDTAALSLGHDLTFDRTISLHDGDTLDFVNPPNVPQSELGVTLNATVQAESTQSIPLPSPFAAAIPALLCAFGYYLYVKRRLC